MAITYPLALPPAPGFKSFRMTGRTIVGMARSPFTMQRQVQSHQGQWWELEFALPPMLRAAGEAWLAFLLALNGVEGRFLIGDPDAASPRGTIAGTVRVNGAGQTGTALIIDGATPSTTLKAGDYFQLGTGTTTRLYKVLQDATADGGGNMTLDIFPRLRESPADNDILAFTNAKGTFALADNEQAAWTTDHVRRYGLSLAAVEAF